VSQRHTVTTAGDLKKRFKGSLLIRSAFGCGNTRPCMSVPLNLSSSLYDSPSGYLHDAYARLARHALPRHAHGARAFSRYAAKGSPLSCLTMRQGRQASQSRRQERWMATFVMKANQLSSQRMLARQGLPPPHALCRRCTAVSPVRLSIRQPRSPPALRTSPM
jgi:hypothetical protein